MVITCNYHVCTLIGRFTLLLLVLLRQSYSDRVMFQSPNENVCLFVSIKKFLVAVVRVGFHQDSRSTALLLPGAARRSRKNV
mmetsp:Transcript_30162/g.46177  ORF Transcript_30162/g.46177 Transcript_30162/m.46177 type:complete len:82 (+) Transcript_30162:428-673(+)